MNDAAVVRVIERLQHLYGILECLVRRQTSPDEPLGQGLSLDVLHDQERTPIVLGKVVEDADAGMLERADGARFALETGAIRRNGGAIGVQQLQCDGPFQPDVARSIHFAHAAKSDECNNLVRAEANTRRKTHGGEHGVYPFERPDQAAHSLACGIAPREVLAISWEMRRNRVPGDVPR